LRIWHVVKIKFRRAARVDDGVELVEVAERLGRCDGVDGQGERRLVGAVKVP
jgi:hypothetical protein